MSVPERQCVDARRDHRMPQRTRATATALWVVVAIGITLGEGILHASGYRPYETIQAELSDARYGPRITSNVWFKSVSGQPIYTVRASSGSDHGRPVMACDQLLLTWKTRQML